MWLAGVEAALATVCLLLSRVGRTVPRRLGHLGLVAWVSLFLGNDLWLRGGGGADTFAFIFKSS